MTRTTFLPTRVLVMAVVVVVFAIIVGAASARAADRVPFTIGERINFTTTTRGGDDGAGNPLAGVTPEQLVQARAQVPTTIGSLVTNPTGYSMAIPAYKPTRPRSQVPKTIGAWA